MRMRTAVAERANGLPTTERVRASWPAKRRISSSGGSKESVGRTAYRTRRASERLVAQRRSTATPPTMTAITSTVATAYRTPGWSAFGAKLFSQPPTAAAVLFAVAAVVETGTFVPDGRSPLIANTNSVPLARKELTPRQPGREEETCGHKRCPASGFLDRSRTKAGLSSTEARASP